MKRKIKAKLIALCVALFSLFFFAGCGKLNDTLDDVLNEYQVTSQVTYYTGVEGWFGNDASGNLIRSRTLYYKTSQKPLAIGLVDVGNKITLTSNEYEIVDWEIVKTDEAGNPLFEDEAKLIPQTTGQSFDFNKALEDGKSYYIVAVWQMVEKLDIKLLGHSFDFVLNGTTYNAGDILTSISYGRTGSISRPSKPLDTGKAYTFLEYYTDETGEAVASWPITRNNTGVNKVVYAKFLEGEWELLKTKKDVTSMFTSGKDNYYLCNDIDCENASFAPLNKFSGKLYGNNFKISNMRFVKTGISTGSYAIFGEITETAQLKDVTFENVSLSYATRPGSAASPNFAKLYFVFTKLASAATVQNVTINNGTFEIDLSRDFIIENMMTDVGATWTTDNYKFGGYTTDADYTGITANVAVPTPKQN